MSVGNSSNTKEDLNLVNQIKSSSKTPKDAYKQLSDAISKGQKVDAETVKLSLQYFPDEFEAWKKICDDGAIKKAAEADPAFMLQVLNSDYKNPQVRDELIKQTINPNDASYKAYLNEAEKSSGGNEFVGQTLALFENFSMKSAMHYLLGLNASSAGLLGKSKFNGILRLAAAWFGPDNLMTLFGADDRNGYTDEQMRVIKESGGIDNISNIVPTSQAEANNPQQPNLPQPNSPEQEQEAANQQNNAAILAAAQNGR